MFRLVRSSTTRLLVTRPTPLTLTRPLSVGKDLGQNKPLGYDQSDTAHASSGSTSQSTRPKRFYKQVKMELASDVKGSNTTEGYCVTLDGRVLRSPRRRPVVHTNPLLVLALAEEWNSQKKQIHVSTMPLNLLFNTVEDKVHSEDGMRENIIQYFKHDTVCHWVDEPAKLMKRMESEWTAPLDAFSKEFGELVITRSIASPVQKDDTIAAVASYINGLDHARLTALSEMSSALKSFILSWGVVNGVLDESAAVKASRVEEYFQIDEWGEVEGNHDLDDVGVLTNVASSLFLLKNY